MLSNQIRFNLILPMNNQFIIAILKNLSSTKAQCGRIYRWAAQAFVKIK